MNKAGTKWTKIMGRKRLAQWGRLSLLSGLLAGLTWVTMPQSRAAASPPAPQPTKAPCASCSGGYCTLPATTAPEVSVAEVVEQPGVTVKRRFLTPLLHRIIHGGHGALVEVPVVAEVAGPPPMPGPHFNYHGGWNPMPYVVPYVAPYVAPIYLWPTIRPQPGHGANGTSRPWPMGSAQRRLLELRRLAVLAAGVSSRQCGRGMDSRSPCAAESSNAGNRMVQPPPFPSIPQTGARSRAAA